MCYKALIDDRCVGGVGRGGQSRGLGFADAGDSGLVRAVSRGRKRSLGRPAARDIEGEIERENSRLRSSATTNEATRPQQPPHRLSRNQGMSVCNPSETVPSHMKQGGKSIPAKRVSG